METTTFLIINTFMLTFFVLVVTLISLLALKKTRKEQRETIRFLKRQVYSED